MFGYSCAFYALAVLFVIAAVMIITRVGNFAYEKGKKGYKEKLVKGLPTSKDEVE